jgi:hypothetical protein
MHPSTGSFDPRRPAGIHLALAACGLLLAGCPQERPSADAGQPAPPVADEPASGQDASAGTSTTDEDVAEDAGTAPDGHEEPGRLKAQGKAPKGVDMGLARDRAADAARRELLRKAKENGLIPVDTRTLEGSTIDRFWFQGKFVHAEASLPIPRAPESVNVPADVPSNSANHGRPEPAATP